MNKLERSLCPTDLSEESERTVRYAVALAQASSARSAVFRNIVYAETNEIDLIAMGAHGSGFGIHTLFGSNVDKALRQARCPVLIAHPLHQTINKSASA
jgi:Universal stress protein family